jgi:hypothetical protein
MPAWREPQTGTVAAKRVRQIEWPTPPTVSRASVLSLVAMGTLQAVADPVDNLWSHRVTLTARGTTLLHQAPHGAPLRIEHARDLAMRTSGRAEDEIRDARRAVDEAERGLLAAVRAELATGGALQTMDPTATAALEAADRHLATAQAAFPRGPRD